MDADDDDEDAEEEEEDAAMEDRTSAAAAAAAAADEVDDEDEAVVRAESDVDNGDVKLAANGRKSAGCAHTRFSLRKGAKCQMQREE